MPISNDIYVHLGLYFVIKPTVAKQKKPVVYGFSLILIYNNWESNEMPFVLPRQHYINYLGLKEDTYETNIQNCSKNYIDKFKFKKSGHTYFSTNVFL